MDAIETRTVEHDGQAYRIQVFSDPDASNPLEDWGELGTILSLNCRHRHFDSAAVEDAIEHNPDAVPLSYYEHGLCLWAVCGELPLGARCPWDSRQFAGVWLPDTPTLAAARHYGGRTRSHFMRKRARQACEVYTQWCNGDVYGYTIERIAACQACEAENATTLDSCWGIFGLDACLNEADAALLACTTSA
jgi:hypothetical protein